MSAETHLDPRIARKRARIEAECADDTRYMREEEGDAHDKTVVWENDVSLKGTVHITYSGRPILSEIRLSEPF